MSGASSPYRASSPSGGTAKTLVLVGLILQLLEVLIVFALGAVFLLVFIGVFLLIAGVFGLIWMLIVYLFSYQRIAEGRYEDAKTPTLGIAILSLITINLISGILYLIAYVKLGDAIRETQAPPPPAPSYYTAHAPPPPLAPPPSSAGGPAVASGPRFC
ncbi:MAG: hypothetical protein ACREB9_08330, partial [Thermoplasmata archaeon]